MSVLEKEWYIQVPWGRMSVIAWGECSNPPVLLCHGHEDSAISFRPLVKLLPQKFYFIGIDLPGFGKSDRFPPGLMISVYDLVYAIEAVAKHFRWKHFSFVGHSLGAILGKFYNLSYPGKVTKLTEIDPINFYAVPPENFGKWYKKYFIDYFDNYEKYNTPKGEAPKIKLKEAVNILKKSRGVSQELALEALDRWAEPADDSYIRYTYDPRIKLITQIPFSPDHFKNIFSNINTPSLIITSDNSCKNGLYRNTKFLLDEKLYPAGNVRVRNVPGDHYVFISWPRNVAYYLALFLLYDIDGLDSKAKL